MQQHVQVRSVCRLCAATCGVVARYDSQGRIESVRGDRDHALSHGYMCPRGLASPAAHNSPERILRPLKRTAAGGFEPIDVDTALDEIAARLGEILRTTGPETVALFKGTQSYKSVAGNAMLNAWLPALKSTRLFTTITIDQSAKQVTMRRMGYWHAGRRALADLDVLLIFGSNPVLSMTFLNLFADPTKRLKRALRRGMKLIVVDPRRTETAGYANFHVQLWPGQDPALVAGILHVILRENWHDAAFCERYVDGLDALRAVVAPFDPVFAAMRAGVTPDEIERVACMFARDSSTGVAAAGTGPSMSPHSNLADHLIECLNVVCGRYPREGEPVPNPGVQSPRRDFRAEVQPAFREWENSVTTSTGHGTLFGELMSGVLSDELLRTDAGRIRAMFVHGGNPAAALPDQPRAVEALRALDLLVAVEPFMTVTAQLCDYILPPVMQYERTDTAIVPHYEQLLEMPFAQFAPAIAPKPADSDLVEDWYPYWALARRLGLPLSYAGIPLDLSQEPSTEDLIRILLRDAQIPFDTIRQHRHGHVFDVPPSHVQPAEPGVDARFQLMPTDVIAELAEVLAEPPITATKAPSRDARFPFLLSVRRLRGMVNSLGIQLDEVRQRHPYNALYMHPEDIVAIGSDDGSPVRVDAETGSLEAIVAVDATMRPGVVSMSHCWGGLPDDRLPFAAMGASTNLLTRTDRVVETVNAMPRLSAIPVRVAPREG